jgi:hypothetical protein
MAHDPHETDFTLKGGQAITCSREFRNAEPFDGTRFAGCAVNTEVDNGRCATTNFSDQDVIVDLFAAMRGPMWFVGRVHKRRRIAPTTPTVGH